MISVYFFLQLLFHFYLFEYNILPSEKEKLAFLTWYTGTGEAKGGAIREQFGIASIDKKNKN